MAINKILVVDDDEAILEAIGDILKTEHYDVKLLPFAEKVFENIGAFNPDLIILDVMLGNVDGSLLCTLISSIEAFRDIPVIMISANGEMRYILSKTCPNSEFIDKPFDMQNLLDVVRSKLKTLKTR